MVPDTEHFISPRIATTTANPFADIATSDSKFAVRAASIRPTKHHLGASDGSAMPEISRNHHGVPENTMSPPLKHEDWAERAVAEQNQFNIRLSPAASPDMPETEMACQWLECHDFFPSAEALYEHVCEKHIGRKATNNLCLTCAWSSCKISVIKRDHMTSHIRVHIPLKPHKCDYCRKAFKRPQDLKKHIKTHPEAVSVNSSGTVHTSGAGLGPGSASPTAAVTPPHSTGSLSSSAHSQPQPPTVLPGGLDGISKYYSTGFIPSHTPIYNGSAEAVAYNQPSIYHHPHSPPSSHPHPHPHSQQVAVPPYAPDYQPPSEEQFRSRFVSDPGPMPQFSLPGYNSLPVTNSITTTSDVPTKPSYYPTTMCDPQTSQVPYNHPKPSSSAPQMPSYKSGQKRGNEALDDFFGDLKRRQLDTTSPASIGQRLLSLQSSLDLPPQQPVPQVRTSSPPFSQPLDYHQSTAYADCSFPHVGSSGASNNVGVAPTTSYQLPLSHSHLSSARTKTDLLTLHTYLEQMQGTMSGSQVPVPVNRFEPSGVTHDYTTYTATGHQGQENSFELSASHSLDIGTDHWKTLPTATTAPSLSSSGDHPIEPKADSMSPLMTPPLSHSTMSCSSERDTTQSPSTSTGYPTDFGVDCIDAMTAPVAAPSSYEQYDQQLYDTSSSPPTKADETPRQRHDSAVSLPLYPVLPSLADSSSMQMHPQIQAQTLSNDILNQADVDLSRRVSGGMLQRAKSNRRELAAVEEESLSEKDIGNGQGGHEAEREQITTSSATATSPSSARGSSLEIDRVQEVIENGDSSATSPVTPALSADGEDYSSKADIEPNSEQWTASIELLDSLKAYLRGRLEASDYSDDDDDVSDGDADADSDNDVFSTIAATMPDDKANEGDEPVNFTTVTQNNDGKDHMNPIAVLEVPTKIDSMEDAIAAVARRLQDIRPFDS